MAQVMRSQLTTAGGVESRNSWAVGNRCVPPVGEGCAARGVALGAPVAVERGAVVVGAVGGAATRRSPEAEGCGAARAIIIRPTQGANGIQERLTG
jgi:hypothetical protein